MRRAQILSTASRSHDLSPVSLLTPGPKDVPRLARAAGVATGRATALVARTRRRAFEALEAADVAAVRERATRGDATRRPRPRPLLISSSSLLPSFPTGPRRLARVRPPAGVHPVRAAQRHAADASAAAAAVSGRCCAGAGGPAGGGPSPAAPVAAFILLIHPAPFFGRFLGPGARPPRRRRRADGVGRSGGRAGGGGGGPAGGEVHERWGGGSGGTTAIQGGRGVRRERLHLRAHATRTCSFTTGWSCACLGVWRWAAPCGERCRFQACISCCSILHTPAHTHTHTRTPPPRPAQPTRTHTHTHANTLISGKR